MVQRLNSSSEGFTAGFADLLGAKRESSAEVGETVAGILADVRRRGDEALVELTAKLDRLEIGADRLRFTQDEIASASADIDAELRAALELAHKRIKAHHEKQKPQDHIYKDKLGVTLGTRWTPVEAVGIYVPGGLASYPSSVLMNAVPAAVAGVERIAMVVPTPDGVVNPAILAAAEIAGVSEIYRIGGAQAVAALAFGTDTIAPVDKIVGPGNAYVAAAKRQVFGVVGIDMIAGPSEVLIIADSSANPAWVAADLLAQAEHGAGAQSILVTTDAALADAVETEVDRQLELLPRADIAREGWQTYGAIIEVPDLPDRFPHRQPYCTGTSRTGARQCRGLSRAGSSRGCGFSRPSHARSYRRLCGRFQPRPADRPLGALRVRPRRARLHEAHFGSRLRSGSLERTCTGNRSAGGSGKPERPWPLRLDQVEPVG